jgi:hypothetical protein
MPIDEKEREAFEQMVKERGYNVTRRENGAYDSSHTDLMRATWNAALAYESDAAKAQAIEQPVIISLRECAIAAGDVLQDAFSNKARPLTDVAKAVLDAAGVKYVD